MNNINRCVVVIMLFAVVIITSIAGCNKNDDENAADIGPQPGIEARNEAPGQSAALI